jgi:hypothetical protein
MSLAARVGIGLLAIVLYGSGLKAQSCGTFDVASVKVNTSGGKNSYPELAPGGRRLIATNQYMVALIMFAWDFTAADVGYPERCCSGKVRYRGYVRATHDEGTAPAHDPNAAGGPLSAGDSSRTERAAGLFPGSGKRRSQTPQAFK